MKNLNGVLRGSISGALLLFVSASAHAATIPVPSPGANQDIQANIQSALAQALDGDTLALPSGNFTLSGSINVTKKVTIKGNGIGNTVIYRSESMSDAALAALPAMFEFAINSTSASNIRVRGITFKSKRPSLSAGDGLSLALDVGLLLRGAVDFKIEACRFENFGNAGILVRHTDQLARGLIAKNEFYRNAKGNGLGFGYGVVVYGSNQNWVDNPNFGSNNFIFIENNSFDYHRHAIAGGGAGLYVARYNLITNNIVNANKSTHAIDAHEARDNSLENRFSTRAVEIYKNTIINTTFFGGAPITPGPNVDLLIERSINIRGGEALIHNNKIDGYRFGFAVTAFPLANQPSPYPILYAAGYRSGASLGPAHSGINLPQADGDMFYWSNSFNRYKRANGTPEPQSVEFYNYVPSDLVAGRDFHAATKPNYVPYVYPHPLQCATDVNRDGTTSNADLSLVQLKLNQTCAALDPCPTDINKDGLTDQTDINLVNTKLGQACQ